MRRLLLLAQIGVSLSIGRQLVADKEGVTVSCSILIQLALPDASGCWGQQDTVLQINNLREMIK